VAKETLKLLEDPPFGGSETAAPEKAGREMEAVPMLPGTRFKQAVTEKGNKRRLREVDNSMIQTPNGQLNTTDKEPNVPLRMSGKYQR
jgi:hypothetical protein